MVDLTKHHRRSIRQLKGVPIRDVLLALELNQKNNLYMQLLLYLVFLTIFLAIQFSLRTIHASYEQNDTIRDLLMDEEFGISFDCDSGDVYGPQYHKTFNDIMTFEEYWEWMEGPVYNAFFARDWYNGDPYEGEEEFMMGTYNELVGEIQLRQARVRPLSCKVHGSYSRDWDTCYDYYSKENRETTPFVTAGGDTFEFSRDLSVMPGKTGYFRDFGREGYVTHIPRDYDAAWDAIQSLKATRWLDLQTRAVALNFNVYNRNTRIITVVRMQVEFAESGHVVKQMNFLPFPAGTHSSAGQITRGVFEVVFFIMLMFYIYTEYKEFSIKPQWQLYWFDMWNVVECVNLLLYFAVLCALIAWYSDEKIAHVHSKVIGVPHYVDLFDEANLFDNIATMAAINCCFGIVKIFKYLQLRSRLNILWDTLSHAFRDLIALMVVFSLIVSGFATMAHLVLGPFMIEFHNFASSVSTLLTILGGEFKAYEGMRYYAPKFAPLLIIAYVFIVFMVLLNMFIAVIIEHHGNVKAAHDLQVQSALGHDRMVPSLPEQLWEKTAHALRYVGRKLGRWLGDSVVVVKDEVVKDAHSLAHSMESFAEHHHVHMPRLSGGPGDSSREDATATTTTTAAAASNRGIGVGGRGGGVGDAKDEEKEGNDADAVAGSTPRSSGSGKRSVYAAAAALAKEASEPRVGQQADAAGAGGGGGGGGAAAGGAAAAAGGGEKSPRQRKSVTVTDITVDMEAEAAAAAAASAPPPPLISPTMSTKSHSDSTLDTGVTTGAAAAARTRKSGFGFGGRVSDALWRGTGSGPGSGSVDEGSERAGGGSDVSIIGTPRRRLSTGSEGGDSVKHSRRPSITFGDRFNHVLAKQPSDVNDSTNSSGGGHSRNTSRGNRMSFFHGPASILGGSSAARRRGSQDAGNNADGGSHGGGSGAGGVEGGDPLSGTDGGGGGGGGDDDDSAVRQNSSNLANLTRGKLGEMATVLRQVAKKDTLHTIRLNIMKVFRRAESRLQQGVSFVSGSVLYETFMLVYSQMDEEERGGVMSEEDLASVLRSTSDARELISLYSEYWKKLAELNVDEDDRLAGSQKIDSLQLQVDDIQHHLRQQMSAIQRLLALQGEPAPSRRPAGSFSSSSRGKKKAATSSSSSSSGANVTAEGRE